MSELHDPHDNLAPRNRLRAHAAYTMGRLWWAVPRALLVALPVGALAFALGATTAPALIGGAVASLMVVAGWRSRGALVGAVLGCVAACVASCVVAGIAGIRGCGALEVKLACVGVGGLVGAVVGWISSRLREGQRFDIVVGALAGCALQVLLGCAVAGVAESIGLVMGLVVGVVPVVVWRTARA